MRENPIERGNERAGDLHLVSGTAPRTSKLQFHLPRTVALGGVSRQRCSNMSKVRLDVSGQILHAHSCSKSDQRNQHIFFNRCPKHKVRLAAYSEFVRVEFGSGASK